MGGFEVVDRLCSVTAMLADIVREQAAIIEQADVPDSVKEELKQKRNAAELELDRIKCG